MINQEERVILLRLLLGLLKHTIQAQALVRARLQEQAGQIKLIDLIECIERRLIPREGHLWRDVVIHTDGFEDINQASVWPDTDGYQLRLRQFTNPPEGVVHLWSMELRIVAIHPGTYRPYEKIQDAMGLGVLAECIVGAGGVVLEESKARNRCSITVGIGRPAPWIAAQVC